MPLISFIDTLITTAVVDGTTDKRRYQQRGITYQKSGKGERKKEGIWLFSVLFHLKFSWSLGVGRVESSAVFLWKAPQVARVGVGM